MALQGCTGHEPPAFWGEGNESTMRIQRGPWRKRLSAALIAAISAAAVLGTAATANAGTYTYWSCKTPAGNPTSTQGWTNAKNQAYAELSNSCATGGSLSAYFGGPDVVVSAPTYIRWEYNSPEGTTVVTATPQRYWSVLPGNDGAAAAIYSGNWNFDAQNVVEMCIAFTGGCRFSPGPDIAIGGQGRMIGFEVGCYGSGSCMGDTASGRAFQQWGSTKIILRDDTDPAAANPSGTALENTALRGAESLTIGATDTGSGVWQGEVRLGSTVVTPRAVVAANGGRCNAIDVEASVANEFAWAQPCQSAAQGSWAVDTTRVPDGEHTLSLTLWDAAGNASTVLSRKVRVDNVPPPAIKLPPSGASQLNNPNSPRIDGDGRVGAQLTAFDGNWTDASAQLSRVWQVSDSADGPWTAVSGAVASTYRPSALQAGKYLRLTVTAVSSEGTSTATSAARLIDAAASGGSIDLTPNNEPAKSTGGTPGASASTLAALTANNGSGGDPASGKLVPSDKRKTAKVGFKRTLRVTGQLVDGAGKPITGGQIDVWETVARDARAKVATITTDAKGRYSWNPATRSNRIVELAYSPQRESTEYQSAHTLQVLVRAGVSIKLRRRHVGPFGTGVLTGRVQVDGIPSSGVYVEIHSRNARGRDLVIDTVKTDGNGRFRWKRRFDARYGYVPLSARVLADRDMPAIPGRSRQVRLLIG